MSRQRPDRHRPSPQRRSPRRATSARRRRPASCSHTARS
jgi:hypothetical protein